MASEHYFTAQPSGALVTRTVHVRLAGAERELVTAGGVFSPDRIDTGTQVLLQNVPAPPPGGNLLDLGCGWGPIALSLALESPRATVWAVDVNERALELVRRNADSLGLHNVNAVLARDVPADLVFRTIWSNPPIRVGKNELHSLLETWLPRLDEASDAWLVVQRNLGSDSLQRWMQTRFAEELAVSRAATNKGYRVLRARRRGQSSGSAISPE
ncbi:class I SAM-dependent methyltransferase [Homoserinibacter sp. YIM 151385]|uniref:class I SAM-dependent methyltransferase n=1 Tax=Homoserinibacter sp. YIM 151385 TaxID=2985506 RepID=UPI0022F07D50|nr:methyltransferase [Homoserinibacter sp. YIM 151385]WBU38892.1 methyltransferase [Homoserinibacter sp. YIM 151385]